MTLLKKATNQTAFAKVGILGFPGSGKTFTAAEFAIGLAQGTNKPVAFYDTETGSDYLIDRFEAAGVELLVAKTRAFKDLLQFMREAEAVCSVAIIDSISHVWTELIDAYTKQLRRTRGLEFQDWAKVKTEWRQFTDLYLNSKVHVILCGRAGYEYELEKNEDTGKNELFKTGTKMKAEGEMSYEPSLLLEMWRVKKSEIARDPTVTGWMHRCVVLKDRTNTMNGAEIDNPTYASFRPHLSKLNIGGEHVGLDTTRTSEDLFDSPESASKRKRQVEIALENIRDAFTLAGLGQSVSDKKRAKELALACFGESAWSAIDALPLEKLQYGLEKLRAALKLDEQREEAPPAVGLRERTPLSDLQKRQFLKMYYPTVQQYRPDLYGEENSHRRHVWQQAVTGRASASEWDAEDFRNAIACLENGLGPDAAEITAGIEAGLTPVPA